MTMPHQSEKRPTISEILAALPESERVEAQARVEEFVEVAYRIYERVCADKARHAELRALLTAESAQPYDAREKQENSDSCSPAP